MPDKKFSDFTAEGNLSLYTGLVGYDATDNYFITPAELNTALEGTLYATTPLAPGNGGTGLTSISTLQNANVNYASDGTGILPITKGGTGYNNSYKSVQVFVWTTGNPVAYNNVANATPTKIPFDPTALISTIEPATLANAQWVCTNSGAGFPGTFATFTLGTAGAGLWKIRVAQHWFDQTNNVEVRASLIFNGGTPIDVVDEKSTELTGDKIFYGELIQACSASDTLELEMEFNGGGVTPFPSAAGQRPPEISFERLI